MKNFGIELEVIDLGIVIHVVRGKWPQDEEVRMLRPRTAHARSKEEQQKGESNLGHSLPGEASYWLC